MVGAVTWKIRFKKERGGVGPSKNWVGQKFLLQRGNKTGMGGVATFFTTLQFSSVTFTLCVGESKVSLYYFSDLQSPELAMQDFHPCSHSSLVLKPGIICAFLIHSGSIQKMLTALFDLV